MHDTLIKLELNKIIAIKSDFFFFLYQLKMCDCIVCVLRLTSYVFRNDDKSRKKNIFHFHLNGSVARTGLELAVIICLTSVSDAYWCIRFRMNVACSCHSSSSSWSHGVLPISWTESENIELKLWQTLFRCRICKTIATLLAIKCVCVSLSIYFFGYEIKPKLYSRVSV